MKHLLARSAAFVFSAGLLCGVPAFAQTDTPPPPSAQTDGPPPGGPHRFGPERRVEMLQHALNLSADQTTQVKAVLEGERTRMDALRTNTAASQEDRHTQVMAIHKDTNSRIRALLTADQATKYDAMEARMREHRPGDAPPPPPSDGPGAR